MDNAAQYLSLLRKYNMANETKAFTKSTVNNLGQNVNMLRAKTNRDSSSQVEK